MFKRRQHRLAHLTQKRPVGWIPGKIRTQDNWIGKEAHQPFKLGPAPSYHGRSHEDVLLTAVVVEHQFERRQQNHVQRRPLGFSERLEPPGQFLIQSEIVLRTTKHLNRRSRPVGRQIEYR